MPESRTAKKPVTERGGIQSLERAAALMSAVAATGRGGIPLGELSAQVGLNTSTAHHLVRTLEALGFLARVGETKRYRIGSRLFVLAAGALDESALLLHGTPILERLSNATGEAAHLAVRSNADIVLIARSAAKGMLQMSDQAGITRPAHATAIGKMLLSQCDPEDRERILSALDFPALTENTITDADAFAAHLGAVLATDVARDRCELDADVCCVAVPVRDFAGRCVAAMGLSGPVWRMTPELEADKTRHLQHAARELSEMLGYSASDAAR